MSAPKLIEHFKSVTGLAPIVPSSSTPRRVSLKDYNHLTVIITVRNATTVTGSAITLHQATTVAGAGEKALAFASVWQNLDTTATDDLTQTAVVSNTFTTLATNSAQAKYVLEVDASDLDINNGFDVVRVGTGNATAATLSVEYLLSGPRYKQAALPTAITD